MEIGRQIISKHSGRKHGPLTRLIDPSDLGDALKPFVFLDYFSANVTRGFGFPMHPHSGIATLTWQPGCDVRYEDTSGKRGILKAGGLEWMNAGGGAWHQGTLETEGFAQGFQLWVPMPPLVEDGPSFGQYVPPEQVPKAAISAGSVTLLLGSLVTDSMRIASPIESHQDMNYFVLDLRPHSSWTYEPPAAHSVVWAFPFEGDIAVAGVPANLELLNFTGKGPVEFASGPQSGKVLIGSARRHDFELVLGPSSIHTNPASLRDGTVRIMDIGRQLSKDGKLAK